MGFTPREVGDMSLWQFAAVADGFAASRGSGEGLSAEETRALDMALDAAETKDV